ncbi:hypothetical protein OsI_28273 [Oryza sativa Indica Group]|uniref:Acyl-CoA-binding domain-containing protein n=1 Tax=Oryza sativa subsp. indica TaxID=39946 RepID=A2YSG8_ORYSI|nr:hypothetical protein OsI_28273 [Oryza sativa Indica Group]
MSKLSTVLHKKDDANELLIALKAEKEELEAALNREQVQTMHLKEEIAEAEARNAELTKLRHSMGCGWRRRVASDELRCDHWRRAPGVTWLWMMEDAAFGDELRCDVARGHRRTWPPAMSLAWGVRAAESTASNKPGVGRGSEGQGYRRRAPTWGVDDAEHGRRRRPPT